MLSKTSPPQDCDLNKPSSLGVHLEEMSLTRSTSPKIPQDATREVKMEVTKSPKHKISELLKGKEEEWTAVAKRGGPLRILDLPLDLLREILREVSMQPTSVSLRVR